MYTLSIILVSLIPGKSASHPCSKSGYPAKRTGIYMSFFPLYVRSSVNLKDNRHYKLINRLKDIIKSMVLVVRIIIIVPSCFFGNAVTL